MRGRRIAMGLAAALAALVFVPTAAVAGSMSPAAIHPASQAAPARAGDARAVRRDASASAHHAIAPRSSHVARGDRGRSSPPVPAVLRGAVAAGGLRASPWSPGSEPAPARPAVDAISARGPPTVV
jgi:hypothetical protein